VKPFDALEELKEQQVFVKLKNGMEMSGVLKAFDQHMNLVLDEASELENDEVKAKIGTVIVRGDNILYVSP